MRYPNRLLHTYAGASKLAPIISIMHERLKAAQALQMMNSAADSRQSDIDSVVLLQEVGRGGKNEH